MGASNSRGQEKYLCLQMHNAILGGNENVVRDLLLCGAVSPNNKLFTHSRKLVLPLVTAVENNCLALVQVLLQHNASTSAYNKDGNTPLHIAAAQNLLEIAETLLRHQADPNALSKHGETPLHIAASYGLVAMATLLISHGALVNHTGKHRRTPLHSACAVTGNNDMISALLNNGVDPNCLDDDQRVPLHYLGLLGKTQGIDILLQSGANKNATDSTGKTALHFTVQNQEVQATRALIRHGCDVNVQNNNGETPLHKAVEKEFSELVSLLLENRADANLPTNAGFFPLRIAVWKKNFDIAQSLLSHGGAQVNACDRTGITALHVACLYALKDSEEDIELIELLLASGAHVNAQCSKHGRSPLHNAVEANNDEAVVLLLRNGADPDLVDNKGKSPRAICSARSISDLFCNLVTNPVPGGGGAPATHLPEDRFSFDFAGVPSRPTNFYMSPNTGIDHALDGNAPPPLPPRDTGFHLPSRTVFSPLMPALPQGNVIRHNFVWSSSEADDKPSVDAGSNRLKMDVQFLSKLIRFPTSFGVDRSEPTMFCYSISRNPQLLNTTLGCVLNIESGSVDSTLLLYVQALNYSTDLLPMPDSHRLCSNVIHFYTHYVTSGQRDIQPEKEVPRLSKSVLVQFPLRKSAVAMFNRHEHEFKVLVSFDEGLKWEEAPCRIDKFPTGDDPSDVLHMAVCETDELGMYAVVLCPKRDVKFKVKHGDKVTSSVDPAISVTIGADCDQTFTVATSVECVPPTVLEKLHNQGFAYVLSCSRVLSLQLSDADDNAASVSICLPISVSHSSLHGDVSYRVLRHRGEPIEKGWQCCRKDSWEDVTQKDVQHLQISTKGKRLLGSSNSSPPHASFDIAVDTLHRHSFLVTAVRSFTASLSKHLVQMPEQIERIKMASSVSFLVHCKATRPSQVTCDIVAAKNADKVDRIYRESSSHLGGPPPSDPQTVYERDCIVISTSGGIKLSSRSAGKSRRITLHSGLLPFSEIFNVKGTTHDGNSSNEYVGSFNFELGAGDSTQETATVSKPRSTLSSESSVLVMENRAFTDRSSSQSSSVQLQTDNNSLLASLCLHLPRKHHSKATKPAPSSGIEQSQLNRHVMELVCKRLDRAEFADLAFQLDIPKQRFEQVFDQNPDNVQGTALSILDQWNIDNTALNRDTVPLLCSALSCIGRETLSQDVARRCNPFVLEELSGLAPLPEHVMLNCGSTLRVTDDSLPSTSVFRS